MKHMLHACFIQSSVLMPPLSLPRKKKSGNKKKLFFFSSSQKKKEKLYLSALPTACSNKKESPTHESGNKPLFTKRYKYSGSSFSYVCPPKENLRQYHTLNLKTPDGRERRNIDTTKMLRFP